MSSTGRVATYISRAAEKLRAQKSVCSFVAVYLSTNPYSKQDKQYVNSGYYTFPCATAHTPELIKKAVSILERIYREGYNYKKASVMLEGITPHSCTQTDMFDQSPYTASQERLMTVVDSINAINGRDTIRFATSGIERPWWMKQDYLSKKFTTNWNDLLVAKTL